MSVLTFCLKFYDFSFLVKPQMAGIIPTNEVTEAEIWDELMSHLFPRTKFYFA